jgi:hypothetical protein
MPKRYLAFDIETAKILPEETADLLSHRPLGICCAAAVAGDLPKPLTWYGHTVDGTPAPVLSRDEARALVADLGDLVRTGYTLVTWNGLGFDFDVLSEESGLTAECAQLAWRHVDMMFHVVCERGFPLALDKAAQAMGLGTKDHAVGGARAPVLWAEGRYAEVLDYCVRDVQLTLGLAVACDEQRVMRWITRKGTTSQMALPQGWLSAAEADRLPLPDTSWMTEPLTRERFTGWIPPGIKPHPQTPAPTDGRLPW